MITVIDTQITPFDGQFFSELILSDGRILSYNVPFSTRARARAHANATYENLVALKREHEWNTELSFGDWFFVG